MESRFSIPIFQKINQIKKKVKEDKHHKPLRRNHCDVQLHGQHNKGQRKAEIIYTGDNKRCGNGWGTQLKTTS